MNAKQKERKFFPVEESALMEINGSITPHGWMDEQKFACKVISKFDSRRLILGNFFLMIRVFVLFYLDFVMPPLAIFIGL